MVSFLGRLYFSFRSLVLFVLSWFSKPIPLVHRVEPLDPILTEPAVTLAQKIRAGKYTSRQVTEAYIQRIKSVNGHINAAVAMRFNEALEEADQADRLIASGNPPSILEKPFLGVPCSIKECFALKGMPNTAGLVARVKRGPATFDAVAVARMRNAGFIPLCVTNTSELCMWYESTNNVYGTTNNPYDLSRIVGGSSGGEGALITAAASPVGLGSDIGGSIRMPAFFNGVWGLKPTGGHIPNEGQYPIAANEALKVMTTGPLCRYAEDLWPMFKVLDDPFFDGVEGASLKKFADPASVDLSQVNLYSITSIHNFVVQGVSKDLLGIQKKAEAFLIDSARMKKKELVQGQLKYLKNAPDIWSSTLATSGGKSFSFMCGDEKGNINALWELVRCIFGLSPYTLMAIVLAFIEPVPEMIAPKQVKEFCRQGKVLKQEIAEILGKNGILLFPSHPTVAPHHMAPVFVPFNFAYAAILNILEVPVVQCPLGLDDNGLPVGVQVVAAHGNEHLAIAVAQELQKGFGGWVRPPI